jgi:LPXTG-motif cell wall-anchored protein
MTGRGTWYVIVGAAVACGLVLLGAAPAEADTAPPGTIGSFPTYTITPSSTPGTTFTGTADFAAAAGFPATTFTTDSTTTRAPTGESAYLGASTGFGQYFGSSRSQPYLYLSPAASGPSTTTITFATPPPLGWGFALGDIDADFVEIAATDAGGAPIAPGTLGGMLGARDTTNVPPLNYCTNVPKPSSCTGPGRFTDVPAWFQNGTTIGGTTYTGPIVKGNGPDTSGSFDWFVPTSQLHSLTLTFHVQSGFPIYQLWLAALAPVATISGTVVPASGDPVPVGTDLALEHPDGTPVLDIEDNPVVQPVDPSGAFTVDTEATTYDLAFVVPAGFAPIATIPVDATAGNVDLGTISLAAVAPAAADPSLPMTGTDAAPTLLAAFTLLTAGAVIALSRRRRRARLR